MAADALELGAGDEPKGLRVECPNCRALCVLDLKGRRYYHAAPSCPAWRRLANKLALRFEGLKVIE